MYHNFRATLEKEVVSAYSNSVLASSGFSGGADHGI